MENALNTNDNGNNTNTVLAEVFKKNMCFNKKKYQGENAILKSNILWIWCSAHNIYHRFGFGHENYR
jgi:hypothetical protein